MAFFQKTRDVHRVWRLPVVAALGFLLLVAGAVGGAASQSAQSEAPVATGFLNDMIVHHHQAVDMALMGAMKGSAEIQAIALKIVRGQSLEMGTMQAWVPRNSIDAPKPMMGWMSDRYARLGQHIPEYDKFISACQATPGQMPGMATLDELNRLQQLTGGEFNRLWIRLMTQHHEAATIMIQFAQDHAETSRVRMLAAGMLRDQVQEAAYLRTLALRDGFLRGKSDGR